MQRRGKKTEGYRSKFEAEVASILQRNGVPFDYERSKYPYTVPGMYTSDFTLPGGVVVECKGYMPVMDRKKLLRVKAENPTLDLRLLFQKPNVKLNPKSKSGGMTYAQWADYHGIPWAEGPEIPREWIFDGHA